ncbi:hypothetical protein D3C84_258330 [compost metagenome]
MSINNGALGSSSNYCFYKLPILLLDLKKQKPLLFKYSRRSSAPSLHCSHSHGSLLQLNFWKYIKSVLVLKT